MEVTLTFNGKDKAIKALLRIINIFANESKDIEIVEHHLDEKKSYNPEFVEKIRKAEKQESIAISRNDLWESV